jgi:hypothetical protein
MMSCFCCDVNTFSMTFIWMNGMTGPPALGGSDARSS